MHHSLARAAFNWALSVLIVIGVAVAVAALLPGCTTQPSRNIKDMPPAEVCRELHVRPSHCIA